MGGERERMKDVFDRARRLPKAERGAFLDGLGDVDSKMRAQIEDMLAALDEASGFMDAATRETMGKAARAAVSAAEAGPFEQPGTRIGAYKLLQLIGEGGFGTVFMAEQERPVVRKVALKIIKLGMDTRQVVARFEQERQALAMMDHPNIAKVLDAGATDLGRPYFVMELVKGDPIVEYCDRNNLGIRERLELFGQVCAAVQHAHTKGIIHRDIKPSNVLVSTQDGRPFTKVIDFGIAKATASKLTEKTLFTEHRALIGTPEYMSPEQAEGSLDIDTRTDVYSLGVLLYELLTGTTPFTGKELRFAAYDEIQRIIREVEPPKPSTRLSSNAQTLVAIAARRDTEPRKLGVLVRGELDWIVMKALEKDRSRRYETASSLATDVGRYLSGEAVVAAPPSTTYRVRKFVRRNRGPVLAGSAVMAALVVGAVAFAWQAKVARHQRDLALSAQQAEAEQRAQADAARGLAQAEQARAQAKEAEARAQEAEAQKQAAIARAVLTFQTDMLAAVDPENLPRDPKTGEPLKDTVTVAQAIEAAVKKLDDGSLAEQPLVEAGVRDMIGRTLQGLGRYEEAEPNLRRALELRRAALDSRDAQVAESVRNLAELMREQNKPAEGEALFREAIEIHRATLPPGDPKIAKDLNDLALLLSEQNRFAEAEPLYREALRIQRASLAPEHLDIATTLNNLAELLREEGKLDEAAAAFRESLQAFRASLPNGHPTIARSLNNLALLLCAQGRLAEAEPLFRESLQILRASLPSQHPDLASSMSNLALLLLQQDRLDEAEPFMREALEITRAAYPADHPDIAIAASNLAGVLQAKGRHDQAEPLLREALGILRATLPAGHRLIARALTNLAGALLEQEQPSAAEPLLREALAIREISQPDDPITSATRSVLGDVLIRQNKLGEAEMLLLDAYQRMKASDGALSPDAKARLAETIERIVTLYEKRDAAEPGQGYDAKAAEWKARRDSDATR